MHSATECSPQRDLVCIGAIPLKNFPSRDYEIMRRQDLVRDLVRSEEPQSWNILEVGNELSLKRSSNERRPKPKNFLWKRVPLPEDLKSASIIDRGWRLFLRSYHSPIPHTQGPVLIIIWWKVRASYILCPLSINQCIGLMDMLYNLFHHFIKLSHTFTFGPIMVLIGLLYHSI